MAKAAKKKDEALPVAADEAKPAAGRAWADDALRKLGSWAGVIELAAPDGRVDDTNWEECAEKVRALSEALHDAGYRSLGVDALPEDHGSLEKGTRDFEEPAAYWKRLFERSLKDGSFGSATGIFRVISAHPLPGLIPYMDAWKASPLSVLDLVPYGFGLAATDLGASGLDPRLMSVPGEGETGDISLSWTMEGLAPLSMGFLTGDAVMAVMDYYVAGWRMAAWGFVTTRKERADDFSLVGDLRRIHDSSFDMRERGIAWRLLNTRLEVLCGSEPAFMPEDGIQPVRGHETKGLSHLPYALSATAKTLGDDFLVDVTLSVDGGIDWPDADTERTVHICAFRIARGTSPEAILQLTAARGREFRAAIADVAAGRREAADVIREATAALA